MKPIIFIPKVEAVNLVMVFQMVANTVNSYLELPEEHIYFDKKIPTPFS